MSTTTTHTINTGAKLADALAGCALPGQMANVVADATRPALVEMAKMLGAYDGHSRDARTDLENVVVNAYRADHADTPADDYGTTDTDTDGDGPVPGDTADIIASLIDRSRAAHNADRANTPAPDATPAPAAPRAPRANAARTWVVADYTGTHRACGDGGHCGRVLPLTAFFPTTKGGTVRTVKCARCMDEDRALANPASGLGGRMMTAWDRRLARMIPGRDTV